VLHDEALAALEVATELLRGERPRRWTDWANFRNPHYHGPGDTPGTLDYDRLADVVAAAAVAFERVVSR
jgi:hypothetical protein